MLEFLWGLKNLSLGLKNLFLEYLFPGPRFGFGGFVNFTKTPPPYFVQHSILIFV